MVALRGNAMLAWQDLAALDAMIQDLQKLRGELKYAHSFELDVELD